MSPKNSSTASATFGAGCFWGVEEAFRTLKGVVRTQVGYSGGKTKNPTYEQVCSDETGHAEVVHVEYDPKIISYEKMVDVFWNNHNPTQLNRQGWDVGKQYRSVIFYHVESQKNIAEKSKKDLEKSQKWGDKKIVTQIEPAQTFYPAEEYHQHYLLKRGKTSCHV
jgi:peptide-methionine (S)-S-oxide reductase